MTRWLSRGDQLPIVQICSRLLGKFKLARRSSQLGASSLLVALSIKLKRKVSFSPKPNLMLQVGKSTMSKSKF